MNAKTREAKENPYGVDWENVDLSRPTERDLQIVDPLRFRDLLLEIECNCPEIDEKTIREQFETDLQSRISSAREVFENNLAEILREAKDNRSQ